MTQENVLINIWTKCSLLFYYIMSDRVTVLVLAVLSLVLLTPVSQTVLSAEYKVERGQACLLLTLWYSSSQLELKSSSQWEQSQCLCLIMWAWRWTGVGKLLSQTLHVTSSSSQSQSSSFRLTGSWRLKS